MFGYATMVLLWTLNTIIGNNGKKLHLYFVRSANGVWGIAAIDLIATVFAYASYGNRTNVFNSWYGGDVSISGSVYRTAGPSSFTTASSDLRYLMWNTSAPYYSPITIPSTNYTLIASLAYNGFDNFSQASFWLLIIFSLVDGGL